jgi:hypothetical protein
MVHRDRLTPDERARLTEIQDLLIERYVEKREALTKGQKIRAEEIDEEISDLQHEREKIDKWEKV